jgi:hypothetical protein
MNAAEVRNASGQIIQQSTQTEAALESGLQNYTGEAMTAFSLKLRRVASRVPEWLQSWKSKYSTWKISKAEQFEIKDVARKTGMSVDDVRTLSKLGIRGATLLRRRMAALGVDPDEFSQIQAAIFRDLQKSCSRCSQHGRCGYDLLRDATDPESSTWKGYCPNTEALNILGTLSSTSTENAKSSSSPLDLTPLSH